ncbi:E3 ubiquitin-protein ligase RNF13-like isoform X1 [Macrobrachium rosenbergii]|uniref:E3 ubiquitin-protein ligase RNF13-like isoform X1 n=1 Tax=Macrobrachium rosenbergii TaxID=79674 RepID=UPI0034D75D07
MEVDVKSNKMMLGAFWMLSLLIQQSLSDVVVISAITNKTYTTIADYPASFGPPLPLAGFKGYAAYVEPHNACIVPDPPPFIANYTGLWIGIVKRYNCTFVEKVLNAQHAGYDAVIVHNVGSNMLQPMNAKDRGDEVVIPSVFIGEVDAMMIIENFLYTKKFILDITGDIPFNLQNYLVPFAITIGICFIVMLTFMIVKCVRDYRRSRRHRLSSRALKKLPVHKFKKGDPYECCAVCLEDYVDNDKLRILPCSHAYHCKCIDPWLTKNRRVCPVCKRKVITGDERPSDLDTDSEDENSPLINSDGGTQGGTFTEQRENPFQEAQRLAERRRRNRRPSRHVECGPEGYQRLADSTDDDDGDEEEEEEDSDSEDKSYQGTAAGRPREEGTRPEAAESANEEEEGSNSSNKPPTPTTVSVLVHDAARAARRSTDSSSLCSQNSSSYQGSPPGPVQIAVDVINSPPPSSTQPSTQNNENAESDRDYVV